MYSFLCVSTKFRTGASQFFLPFGGGLWCCLMPLSLMVFNVSSRKHLGLCQLDWRLVVAPIYHFSKMQQCDLSWVEQVSLLIGTHVLLRSKTIFTRKWWILYHWEFLVRNGRGVNRSRRIPAPFPALFLLLSCSYPSLIHIILLILSFC